MFNSRFLKVQVCCLIASLLMTSCEVDFSEAVNPPSNAITEVGRSIKNVAQTLGVSTDKIIEMTAQALGTTNEVAQQTLAEFDQAIGTLDQNSAEWQQVLQDLEHNMAADVKSIISNDLSNLLKSSIAASGAEARCEIDFVGRRVQDSLKQMVAGWLGGHLAFKPVVCATVPATIQFQQVQNNDLAAVEIYGYNFDEVLDRSNFKVLLVNGDVFQDVTKSVGKPSNYALTISFGRNGVGLEPTSDELRVEWSGETLYTIKVVQPIIPTNTPTPTPPPSPTYTPTRTPTSTPTPTPTLAQKTINVTVKDRGDNCFLSCDEKKVYYTYDAAAGWEIDQAQGDYGHPGVRSIEDCSNGQAQETLRNHNYGAVSESRVVISASVWGAKAWGPGALFCHTYTIYLIQTTP